MEASTVGFLVNPIAGMGGRVGLKGTDGPEMLALARQRGAERIAPVSAARFLGRLGEATARLSWLTCSGPMGLEALLAAGATDGASVHVVYHPSSEAHTTSEDTRLACEAMVAGGVDLVVFCGGDGTARDVMEALADRCPVLGVPAGVKMFSGVFALSPEAAAEVLVAFSEGRAEVAEGEVADVDEGAYRRGELAVTLHGTMRVARLPSLVQSMKGVTHVPAEADMQGAIARYVVELLSEAGDPVVVLGAGSTVGAVADRLGVPKTPLGVDVVRGDQVLVQDATEEDILDAIEGETSVRLVVSPIGAQGFLLGRGNQQLSPRVLRAAGGAGSIIIVATPHKVAGLKRLVVDTGDPELDGSLSGMRRVVVGYHDVAMLRVIAATTPGV